MMIEEEDNCTEEDKEEKIKAHFLDVKYVQPAPI
jgi:hypothetical protein